MVTAVFPVIARGAARMPLIVKLLAALDPQALFATTVTLPETNPAGKQIFAIDLVVVNGLPEPGVPPGLVITQPAGAVIVHETAS